MNVKKLVSALFALAGTVLLVGAAVLCLSGLNAGVRIVELPQGAEDCAQAFQEALAAGDLDTTAALLYGQPDLGAGTPEDAQTALVWEAFRGSLELQFSGSFYATDSGLFRDGELSVLDLSAVTASLEPLAQASLTAMAAEEEDPSALYEEDQLREDVLQQVLLQALEQALEQPAQSTYETTLQLLYQDGQWWIVPDQALLKALSGGLE